MKKSVSSELIEAREKKYTRLLASLGAMESVLVALSGGVDSALLLCAAHTALGEKAWAATFAAPYLSAAALEEARALTRALNVHHVVLKRPLPAQLAKNPPDRCFFCKKNMYEELLRVAQEAQLAQVLDGTNTGDLGEYRPGMLALAGLGIQRPLLSAGLAKEDIRALARARGLACWNRIADACLLTRVPHGVLVQEEELKRIDAAEAFLHARGFSLARVRSHPGALARIELLPEDHGRFLHRPLREQVTEKLRGLGFLRVCLDLAGYRKNSGKPGPG